MVEVVQEINLFRKKKRNLKFSFSLMHSAICIFAAAALMIINSLMMSHVHIEQNQTIANLEAEIERISIPTTSASRNIDTLQQEITDLTLEIDQEKVKQQQLAKPHEPRNASAYFTALARQSQPEIWFSSIHWQPEPKSPPSMKIVGSARSAEMIPQLVIRLSKEKVFSGISFSESVITKNKDNFSFVLASKNHTNEN